MRRLSHRVISLHRAHPAMDRSCGNWRKPNAASTRGVGAARGGWWEGHHRHHVVHFGWISINVVETCVFNITFRSVKLRLFMHLVLLNCDCSRISFSQSRGCVHFTFCLIWFVRGSCFTKSWLLMRHTSQNCGCSCIPLWLNLLSHLTYSDH